MNPDTPLDHSETPDGPWIDHVLTTFLQALPNSCGGIAILSRAGTAIARLDDPAGCWREADVSRAFESCRTPRPHAASLFDYDGRTFVTAVGGRPESTSLFVRACIHNRQLPRSALRELDDLMHQVGIAVAARSPLFAIGAARR
jgi:hypothetical protein